MRAQGALRMAAPAAAAHHEEEFDFSEVMVHQVRVHLLCNACLGSVRGTLYWPDLGRACLSPAYLH